MTRNALRMAKMGWGSKEPVPIFDPVLSNTEILILKAA